MKTLLYNRENRICDGEPTIQESLAQTYFSENPNIVKNEALFQSASEILKYNCGFITSRHNNSDGMVYLASQQIGGILSGTPAFGVECKSEKTGKCTKATIYKMFTQQVADSYREHLLGEDESIRAILLESPYLFVYFPINSVTKPLIKGMLRILKPHLKSLQERSTSKHSSSKLWGIPEIREQVSSFLNQHSFNLFRVYNPNTCSYAQFLSDAYHQR